MFFFENYWRFKSKLLNNKKLYITNKINFGNNITNSFFLDKLKKSKFYFEYGSGSSTLIANDFNKRFISIELDKKYYFEIKKRIKNDQIKFFNIGPVGEFSYPILKLKKKIVNYIKSIDTYFSNKDYPDLILVDGRFRIACCLNILRHIQKKSLKVLILLDDYEKRKSYRILNKFFKIRRIGRMAILKALKKKVSDKIYNEYLYDPR
tara:strand:+ start:3996 stop:4616 length:621 start_codon:yes stop_codon:yes gene_type:complete